MKQIPIKNLSEEFGLRSLDGGLRDLTDHGTSNLPADAAAEPFKKLERRMQKQTARAVTDYGMIEAGDRIMVCLSGGKDSYTLLEMLLHLKAVAPIEFNLIAVNLDQKQPGFDAQILPDYLSAKGVNFEIINKDTFSITKELTPEGQAYCAVCSRLRRGTLYGAARKLGCTKVALGHHRDDILATFMLNFFHGGSLKAMPPKLRSDDGFNTVIRPLAYVAERDIVAYAEAQEFPIIPCNLCGSQPNLQRAQTNQLLREWELTHPERLRSMAAALGNITPSHLLDRSLFDFQGL
jgi:tRNA 2-thiocytidine biosynthesis protein TtcA